MQSRTIPLLNAALLALPALAQSPTERVPVAEAPTVAPPVVGDVNERHVQPWHGRPALVPGMDDAQPAPRGEVFFQPRNAEPFTGTTDAELANLPPITLRTADIHDRLYFTEHSDGTWVRGRTYKARVAESGFTYIPFLGASAPRSWPVEFRLESATLAGRALALDDRAAVTRQSDRFVLDRGPVDVVYDVALESVEQSFVLDAAGAAGDLVLTLSVASELEAAVDGAGFRFDGPSGGIDYGSAVVLDGAGRSAHVPASLVGDTLELTVPAAFLASAEGPVIVDPIITTFTVDAISGDQRDIDVAYDFTNDQYTYVYEDTFSGTDVDLYSQSYESNTTFVGGLYIDSSADSWVDPNMANLNSGNSNLVVASRVNGTTGYSEIVGRIMDATLLTVGPEIVIGDANSSWENYRPDVGGNSSGTSFTLFVVVWERRFSGSTQPRYRTVLPDGMLGPIQFFENGANVERSEVVISESTGDPATVNRWNVAYRSEDLVTGDVSIRGIQINAGGAIVAGPSEVLGFASGQDIGEIEISEALDLDGLLPTYAIAYDEYVTAVEDTHIVFCRNNSAVGVADLQYQEHANVSREQAEARLSTSSEDFMVTYLERSPSAPSHNVYITTFDLTEGAYLAISERRTLLGTTNRSTYLPGAGAGIASRFSGGFYTSRYSAIGWNNWNGTDWDALGATHFASNPQAPAFQYCYGNPNSTGERGFIRMEGDRSTTGTKRLIASDLPPNSFGFFLTGQGMGTTHNPGGSQGVLCVSGTIGRYSNSVASSGTFGVLTLDIDPTALSQPSGSVPAMVGQIWNFQCWHRDAVGGSSTSNFTNAVTILFR